MELENPGHGETLKSRPQYPPFPVGTIDDGSSFTSNPFVSAPSSPGREGGAATAAAGSYFFSCPASPVHYVLSSPPYSFSPAAASVAIDEASGSGSFEFDGAAREGTMISADELFLNGQIRPMKPSSHHLRPQSLAPLRDLDDDDCDDVEEAKEMAALGAPEEGGRGRRLRIRGRFIHRRTRSMSPLRSPRFRCQRNEEEEQEEAKELEFNPDPKEAAMAPDSASSSGNRNSKPWIFLKDLLLYRSKSEGSGRGNGREKEKFWHSISFSPSSKSKPPLPPPAASSSVLPPAPEQNKTKQSKRPANGLKTREGSQRRFFCAKAGGLLRFQGVQRLDEGEMDGVMLMKGAPSPGLAVGRDVGARQHHPATKVSTLGPRAAAGAGGGSAAEASGPAAAARHSYMFPLRLDRLWPGRRGAVAGKRKGSEEAAVAERAEDSQVLKELPAEQRSDNWVLKILRVRSVWAEREASAAGGGDREAAAVEDGDRCVGCGSGGHEDGSEGCVIDGVGKEEKLVFDRESFSRLLRRVSLVETELYAKMAYLGSLAYIVSKIKPKNLLKCYGLRFVASSLENNGMSLNSDEAKKQSQDQELKEENSDSEEIDTTKGNSTSVSTSAASNLQYQTTGVLPYGAAQTKDGEKLVEGSSGDKQDRSVSPEEVSRMATTKLVTQAVAGKEEMKQAIAEDLNSSQSLPCEWYICDDDKSATRYFVIQGSETLASWQTNLLFEPIQFEGLDVPVHRGIYEAAKGMYQQMLPEVRTHLKSHGKSATFRFTGHSLGGSLALLVNLMLLIRGEVPATSLLPVITFGAPSIMCGGDYLLRKLGLPKYHVQAITMHRDIVPRAFSCNYPDHVAKILNVVNGNFRNHPCLKNQKLLYAPMGKLLILQPEEKFSPHHHLLPPGSGLYILDNSSVDSDDSERLLQAASLAFLNSPHPLQILSDPSAYGSEGTVYRDHDTNSYLRSIRGVVRQELKLIRKARREHRRRMWWPLVATQDVHPTVVTTRSVGSTNSNQNHFSFVSVLHGGSRTLERFARLVASQRVHMFVVLFFPARLLLLGALSVVS
ncbi:unnamed protein product [Musa banksii]